MLCLLYQLILLILLTTNVFILFAGFCGIFMKVSLRRILEFFQMNIILERNKHVIFHRP